MKTALSAKATSISGLLRLRRLADQEFGTQDNLIVGVNGSYARQEVTAGSDVDLFYLLEGNHELSPSRRESFEKTIQEAGFKLPSKDGVFSKELKSQDMLQNIGGLDDSNASLTRRLLLLLEGDWLHNELKFQIIRSDLIKRYVPDSVAKDKIALFLLNDIIRYWRTLCVDYEHKTQDGKKPRGVRLIKLRFSRMLLTFGGILAVAETHDLSAPEKRLRLEHLFSLGVLDRVNHVLGDKAKYLGSIYEEFLAALDDKEIRAALSSNDFEKDANYVNLRKRGRQFKGELIDLLVSHYPKKHPIHHSLVL
jgi:hypothetical protein